MAGMVVICVVNTGGERGFSSCVVVGSETAGTATILWRESTTVSRPAAPLAFYASMP